MPRSYHLVILICFSRDLIKHPLYLQYLHGISSVDVKAKETASSKSKMNVGTLVTCSWEH